jgi:hypothetical protein
MVKILRVASVDLLETAIADYIAAESIADTDIIGVTVSQVNGFAIATIVYKS